MFGTQANIKYDIYVEVRQMAFFSNVVHNGLIYIRSIGFWVHNVNVAHSIYSNI